MNNIESQRRYRKNHPDRVKESGRKWREKNKKRFLGMVKDWQIRNKERRAKWEKDYNQRQEVKKRRSAMWKVRWAITSGKMVWKNECELCGKKGKTEKHHKDYSKPYDVQFVCRPCHGTL